MKNFSMEKTVPIRLLLVDSEESELKFISYTLSFTLVTAVTSHEQIEQAQMDQSISFTKIMAFLESVVDNSVVFDTNSSQTSYNKFAEFTNNLMVLPDISEYAFMAALHCKINKFIKESTQVDTLTLEETSIGVKYEYTLIEDDYDELPSDEEWSHELSYWDGCWWNRADTNTFDKIAHCQEELDEWNDMVKNSEHGNLFTAIFDQIENSFDKLKEHPGELIKVDFENKQPAKRWQPVLVD